MVAQTRVVAMPWLRSGGENRTHKISQRIQCGIWRKEACNWHQHLLAWAIQWFQVLWSKLFCSSRERLKAVGEEDDRGQDRWMASPTQWTWVWANSGRWWKTEKAWHATVHGVTKSWTWLSDWTTTRWAVGNCKREALYFSLQAHSGPPLATSLCLAPYPLCWDSGLSTGSIFFDWCPRYSEFQSSPGRKSRFQKEKTWGADEWVEQSKRTSQMSWPWEMLGLLHI